MRTITIAALVVGAMFVSGCGSSTAPERLPQPVTVQQVGALLHLTGVIDCGATGESIVGVVDLGVGWKGTTKYAFDTFANSAVRDRWKKVVANLGIVPLWQGPEWVAYKSTNQAKPGC